jgi:hypothetical protein
MAAKKQNPAGCGCLILLVLLLGGLIRACGSGGEDETPTATQSVLGTPTTTPTTSVRWTASPTPIAPTTTTRTPAPTTTTRPAGTPKPRPNPQPDPDPNRDSQRTADPAPPASVYYKNCAAVRAAGVAPIRRGDPGYSRDLDRDGDGVGCAGD